MGPWFLILTVHVLGFSDVRDEGDESGNGIKLGRWWAANGLGGKGGVRMV